MKENNPIRDKSYAFALEVIHYCSSLNRKREYVLSKQLLKSGTSIGANIHEALHAQSRNDFIAKLSIAHKEAGETSYWLCLLRDSGIATMQEIQPMVEANREILRLLTAILKSTKTNS